MQADPEIQLLKYKRKASVILEILKSRSLKEDVEDFVGTIESVIPIINRVLMQLQNMERGQLNTILGKLQRSLDDYESTVVKLEGNGRLKRFLTNSRLRKKLEKLNSQLHNDIEFFVEVIIQVEAQSAEKEHQEDERRQRAALEVLGRQHQNRDLRAEVRSGSV